MKRRYLAQALLVASLGALAATGYAQTTTPTDQTPGSPGAAAPAAGAGTTAAPTAPGMGATTGPTTYGTTTATGRMRTPMTSEQIRAYEKARGECEAGPSGQRVPCWTTLRAQYSGVSPKCEALTGNALDACIHQDANADTAGK